MKKLILTSLFILFGTNVSAQYNVHVLAEATGGHFHTISLISAFTVTKCKYIFKGKDIKKFDVDRFISRSIKHFAPKDRNEMSDLLKNLKQKSAPQIKNDLDRLIRTFDKDKMDYKTGCGALMGTFSNAFSETKRSYENAVKYHSYK